MARKRGKKYRTKRLKDVEAQSLAEAEGRKTVSGALSKGVKILAAMFIVLVIYSLYTSLSGPSDSGDVNSLISDSFQDVCGDAPVLYEFYADWCPHCMNMEPVVNSFKDRVNICQLDVDQAPVREVLTEAVKQGFDPGIPHFLYWDGSSYSERLGEMSSAEFESWLRSLGAIE